MREAGRNNRDMGNGERERTDEQIQNGEMEMHEWRDREKENGERETDEWRDVELRDVVMEDRERAEWRDEQMERHRQMYAEMEERRYREMQNGERVMESGERVMEDGEMN